MSQPLNDHEARALLAGIPGWNLLSVEGTQRIERSFEFQDFAAALAFTNKVGALAEKENHHPTMLTEWGRVTVTWWTHTVGGLEERDFSLAAATSALHGT